MIAEAGVSMDSEASPRMLIDPLIIRASAEYNRKTRNRHVGGHSRHFVSTEDSFTLDLDTPGGKVKITGRMDYSTSFGHARQNPKLFVNYEMRLIAGEAKQQFHPRRQADLTAAIMQIKVYTSYLRYKLQKEGHKITDTWAFLSDGSTYYFFHITHDGIIYQSEAFNIENRCRKLHIYNYLVRILEVCRILDFDHLDLNLKRQRHREMIDECFIHMPPLPPLFS